MNSRAALGSLLVLSLLAGTGWWYYANVHCHHNLALSAPNSEFGFERDAGAGTVTITHAGGDALLDSDGWTNRGCREEWEPDAVSIAVRNGSSDRDNQQTLWVARNGSGVGELPLAKGSSVILAETGASEAGDIQLTEPLQDEHEIRVVGYGGGNSATFGTYEVEELVAQ